MDRRQILYIFLFALGWVFMYADRNILAPVMGIIGEEWDLSKAQLGLMSTVFFLSYALMQIPTGFLADRYGRVRVLVIGFIFFGLATFVTGLAPTFGIFLLMRLLTGFGEGTYYGSQYGISSNTIDPKYRGFASAIINSGMAVGISLGFIGSSYLAFDLGKSWNFVFYLFAIPTIITAILIGVFVKDKPLKKQSSEGKEEVKGEVKEKIPLKVLFTRNHILTYILMFCSLYGFFGMLTWLPYFLQTTRGLEGTETGIISSLVPWASVPGALLFGYISDKIKNKKALVVALAFGGGLIQFMIPYVESYSLLIVGLIIYGFIGKLALDPVLIAFVADITPSSMYSKGYAFFNFAGMLSSIVAPYVTGYLADVTGSLAVGFYLSGILLLIGGGCFLFANKETVYSVPEESVPEETSQAI